MPLPRVIVLALLFGTVGGVAMAEPPAPIALSPFGIGSCYTNNRSARDNARWLPQMAAIGLAVHRTPHTDWGAVEPESGTWAWGPLDEQMKYLDEHKFTYGAILAGSPKWNTKDKPGTLPVNNLPGWSRYATELAKHVKGRVRHFEVWNEPPNFTGKDQTPADYAKIVVAAHDAIKAVDPTALVGLAAKSAHVNYLEQVINAGAKDHFDYVVLHPYEVLNGVADNTGSESVYMHVVPTVRKMLAARNPAKVNVPIVFTELGSDAKRGGDHQAHALVKAYAMGIAQGVACVQWFEGRDGDSGPMGLLDNKGKPRPAYTAMGQMIKHLGQHPSYLGWVLLNDRHYGFVFQGAAGTVLATWASGGTPAVVDFGREVAIANPVTGNVVAATSYELTVAPVLVLGVPEPLVAQAKANAGKPFPWDGDYTDAQSVSITFGEKTIEKGLHTRSGSAVAEAVVAYGGSARAGNVPGGSVFIIDPNFLSYTPTPIEITAVVRRNPANDNAGFKLVYESATGFKTAGGWYTVPDNKQWHTVHWRIDDSQFVNYWGFNFNLESDGDKYNKYFLQSVTVTKLAK
ncbi:glycoside hydrolase family protein [Limnoglobus roseus]|uniref:Uncharacterized protein n=1 Tax=Limnoglobus roseus TaxID=2598579 RepID=A0A5C1AC22_9BACT|nr:hypothetical protein [Limnoglobus roseus]QEL16270.1 hypothetical protein PX52LOC_03211 [Limnoglobus roseus]